MLFLGLTYVPIFYFHAQSQELILGIILEFIIIHDTLHTIFTY